MRDLLFLALTCTYALGFAVWSVYAWRQGIGLLPIANLNYFIAGLPIVVIIGVTYSLLRSRHWLESWASRDAPRRARIVHCITIVTMLASASMEGFGVIPQTSWSVLPWEIYVIFKLIVFILFLVLILVDSELHRSPDRFGPTARAIRGFIWVSVLLSAWNLYDIVVQTYPMLPQELGGVRPRPAVLHMRLEDLSSSLRTTLLAGPASATTGIGESVEVLVMYADSERLIVKIPPRRSERAAADVMDAPAYELKATVVVAATYLK